jgi:hypothetical protein
MGACVDCTDAILARYCLRAPGAGGAVAVLRGLCAERERRHAMPKTTALKREEVTALIRRLETAIDRIEQNVQRLLDEKATRA